jgi:site-specific DNA recombinase
METTVVKKKGPARPKSTTQLNELSDLTIGYCRVSTCKQLDDGVSLEAQAERIEHYAAALGMPTPRILTEAKSGKNLDRRQWEAAMKLIGAGRVRRLIVYKLDRLSRSLRDLITLAEALQANNCELHVIAENVNTDSSSGRLFFHILGALAQWTREVIAENTRQAMAFKRARNEYTGGRPPFGYRIRKTNRTSRAGKRIDEIEPDAHEQHILNFIREMIDQGFGPGRIYRELLERGVRNTAGRTICRKQVHRIIGRLRAEIAAEAAA